MVDKIDIDFLPSTFYVDCDEHLAKFCKEKLITLERLLGIWVNHDEIIKLSNLIIIRFKNQLRHFLFFKSFLSVQRCIKQLIHGPILKGVFNFIKFSSKSDSNRCLSLQSYDHLLICLIQLYKKISVIIFRLIKCWRVCDAQFTTGHFTKVLMLILTIISCLRVKAQDCNILINSVYKDIFAIRCSLPKIKSWFLNDVSLPSQVDYLNNNCVIFDKTTILTKDTNMNFDKKSTTVMNTPDNRHSIQYNKVKKTVKRLSDSYKSPSLATVLALSSSKKKHGDLLTMLLKQ